MGTESLRRIAVAIIGVKEKIKIKIKAVDGDGGPLPVDAIGNVDDGYFELHLANAVRSISRHIGDTKLQQSVMDSGGMMLDSSFSSMKNAYAAEDDVPPCGNDFWFLWWLMHHPVPGPDPGPDPLPYFKQMLNAGIMSELFNSGDPIPIIMENYGFNTQVICAELLRQVAGLTLNRKASAQILSSAIALMKANSAEGASAMFDDRCGSTGPRHIGPRGIKIKEKIRAGAAV